MVFTRLSAHEKEAFFGLLDEYFQSRPEIFGQGNGQLGVNVSPAAAASVVRMAASAAGTNSGTKSNNPYAALSNVDVGRVASLAAGHTASPAATSSEVDKLVTAKSSVLSAFKKQGAPGAVAIPPAFGAPRAAGTYGPPPVRRGASEQPPAPAPEGEWAEVLYDYSSDDPGDLSLTAGARVRVTVKSSEDWWTGRVQGQGREGLFPASYVKLI